ncbi:protein C11orf74 homolog [Chanos chanos]|uniref:Protein C11orf74 homolog n=1 Tax=Chanos chanos TaxID=29144 RepID=A0A6J2UPT3_CHACN|nr:protein C11orf74 homolog [Chanos chanos]XP_030622446.1 protein C11orf74 homolog [Chanos chanos]
MDGHLTLAWELDNTSHGERERQGERGAKDGGKEGRGELRGYAEQENEEELTLDTGATVGRLSEGEAPRLPVKFDNYVGVCDKSQEEHSVNASQDVCVLPGEVEDDLPVYTASFCHYTQLELTSTAREPITHSPQSTEEGKTEEELVLPFCLDENFDYDNVVLSRKHPLKESASGPRR